MTATVAIDRPRSVGRSLVRTIVTPEGIPIDVELASRGDRAIAFILDALFITLAIVALVVLLFLTIAAEGEGGDTILSLTLIAFFFCCAISTSHISRSAARDGPPASASSGSGSSTAAAARCAPMPSLPAI